MICPNCKKENADNTKWCCYCGSLLELSPMEFELDEPFDSEEQEQSRQPSSSTGYKPQGYNSKEQTQRRKSKRRNRFRRRMRILLWIVFVLSILVAVFATCMYFFPFFNQSVYQNLGNMENMLQSIHIL